MKNQKGVDESNISAKDFSAQLVTLIVNQDHMSQEWLKHLVTIQAGLAVALGFILRPSPDTVNQLLPWFAVFAIPFVGITSTVAIVTIIIREHQWQSWYIKQLNNLSGSSPSIFPKNEEEIFRVDQLPIGYISRVILAFGAVLVISWLVVIINLFNNQSVISMSKAAIHKSPIHKPLLNKGQKSNI